jgi:hypothetical protein
MTRAGLLPAVGALGLALVLSLAGCGSNPPAGLAPRDASIPADANDSFDATTPEAGDASDGAPDVYMADDGSNGASDGATTGASDGAPDAWNGVGCYPPGLRPLTCEQQRFQCGMATDGHDGGLDCGPCPAGETCTPEHRCVASTDSGPCAPATCQALGYDCGWVSDGCGQLVDCGTCPLYQFCGGGGRYRCGGLCWARDHGCVLECYPGDGGASSCWGTSCREIGPTACGIMPNGCGGTQECVPCPGDAGAD